MQKPIICSKERFLKAPDILSIVVLLIWTSLYVIYKNYMLYHTGVELYCAIIAFIILVIYLNSYSFNNHSYYSFWCLAAAFVGIFNLLHIFLQDGITLFPHVTQAVKYHIWVTQRFGESFSFFFAIIIFLKKKISKNIFTVYFLILTILTGTVFSHFLIPQSAISSYVHELSEISISFIQFIAVMVIIYFRKQIHPKSFSVFLVVSVMMTAYELSILLLPGNNVTFNILGHSFKAISYYMIYKAVSTTKLQLPFKRLIEELEDRNEELEVKTNLLEKEVIERKEIEKEIEASRDFYLEILEKFPSLIWRAGLDGNYNYFNKNWLEFTGRSKESELSCRWTENIHDEDRDEFLNRYEECFRERKEFSLTYRYRRYDGAFRWIENIGRPFNDQHGAFSGYIGMCNDITPQKERQEEIIRYKLLTEMAKDIILFVKLDGQIIDANNAAIKAYGYSYQELTSLTVFELREQGSLTYEHLKQAEISGVFFETVHLRKDGSRFPVEVSSSGVTIGDTKILMSVIRDITERKLAEEEIRKLTLGIEQSPSAIIITNIQGIIEYANPKFTEVTGYTKEEILGKTPGFLKSEHHQDQRYNDLWMTIQSGETWRGEILNKKVNGDLYWAIISISPIRNSENIITHYVAIQEDITAQKLLQQKLEDNNRKLEDTLEKLKITQGQLIQQEKLAGIGQLAAGVAHEINNPLGFVMSNFETLKKYISKFKETIDAYRNLKTSFTSDTEKKDGIEPILKCIIDVEKSSKIDFILEDLDDLYKDTDDGLSRISRIVTSLRNFSRVDKQNEFLEYDLNSGIKNTLTVANNEIKYHAVVEENLGDIPVIYANGGQINQVLLNIILNAVHAVKENEPGGRGVITVNTYCKDEYVYCSIQDTGTGIAENHLNRIFEPFFTTKKIGEGTGLGLSISYDIIVNKHKGELDVESRLGMGTKFTIKLPIKQVTEK